MSTVFFDVDTQFDFLYPAGALYAPGAETVVPAIARLNRLAASRGFTVVSTVCAHAEDDVEFRHWPAHCIVGSLGQRKPSALVVDRGQILFPKQTFDAFDAPGMPALLSQLQAERYVVYGVVTEVCVRCAAFGLLKTGKPVELVTDAVQSLRQADGDAVLAAFQTAGGVLTTLEQLRKRFGQE